MISSKATQFHHFFWSFQVGELKPGEFFFLPKTLEFSNLQASTPINALCFRCWCFLFGKIAMVRHPHLFLQSGDSQGCTAIPNVPRHGKSLYKPYNTWVFAPWFNPLFPSSAHLPAILGQVDAGSTWGKGCRCVDCYALAWGLPRQQDWRERKQKQTTLHQLSIFFLVNLNFLGEFKKSSKLFPSCRDGRLNHWNYLGWLKRFLPIIPWCCPSPLGTNQFWPGGGLSGLMEVVRWTT